MQSKGVYRFQNQSWRKNALKCVKNAQILKNFHANVICVIVLWMQKQNSYTLVAQLINGNNYEIFF